MTTPAQMYDHTLDAIKGKASDLSWVDKSADLAATSPTILQGACFYLDANGDAMLGLNPGAMAIFALQNSTDFDVQSDRGNISGGTVSGLVAAGAFELETTEYNDGETYAPNDALTAHNTGVHRGEVTRGVPYRDTICGVVSDGVVTNEWSNNVLRFWPVWLPPNPLNVFVSSSSSSGQAIG